MEKGGSIYNPHKKNADMEQGRLDGEGRETTSVGGDRGGGQLYEIDRTERPCGVQASDS